MTGYNYIDVTHMRYTQHLKARAILNFTKDYLSIQAINVAKMNKILQKILRVKSA